MLFACYQKLSTAVTRVTSAHYQQPSPKTLREMNIIRSKPEWLICCSHGRRLAAQVADARDERLNQVRCLSTMRSPGARSQAIVHQDHRTRPQKRLYGIQHLGRGVTAPVVGISSPECYLHSDAISDLTRPMCCDAPRGARAGVRYRGRLNPVSRLWRLFHPDLG